MNRTNHALGMSMMIGAMLVLPIRDAIAKYLVAYYDVIPDQITFGKFLGKTIILGIIVLGYFGIDGAVRKQWEKLVEEMKIDCFGIETLRGN